MNTMILIERFIVATIALSIACLSCGCHSAGEKWDRERIVGSEVGAYSLHTRAKTMHVPFQVLDKASARRAFVLYAKANGFGERVTGLDSDELLKEDDSDGVISFYAIVMIGSTQIALFAPKGGVEVSEVAVDVKWIK